MGLKNQITWFCAKKTAFSDGLVWLDFFLRGPVLIRNCHKIGRIAELDDHLIGVAIAT